MKKNIWTYCWKCEQAIWSKHDCKTFKSKEGHFDFCPSCYKEFIDHNKKFIRPERSRLKELERSLHWAMASFHELMMEKESGGPIAPSLNDYVPTHLIHHGSYFQECDVCKEILNLRCSKQCS